MNKKERVIAAIKGEPACGVPSGFSLHFPAELTRGDAAVKAHLDFFRATDTDILKIMNENLVPCYGEIACAADYARLIPTISMRTPWMADQIDLTRRILDASDGDAFTLGTLHGTLASCLHPIEKLGIGYEPARDLQLGLLRENERKALDGMRRIVDGMCELARAYIEAGVDGVYYAALGGERRWLTDEEFARWIEPFDKQILSAIREAGGYAFLHICKDGLNMNRYADYGAYADVVNWGVYEAPLSIEDGRALFPGKTVFGGLPNRSGVLVNGTDEEIHVAVTELLRKYGPDGFILGADCTLATEQDLGKVRIAVETARAFRA